jgi:hypothetical protein
MSGLEDLFTKAKLDHPKLRAWSADLAAGAAASLEVRRARDGITVGPPILHIELTWPDGRVQSDHAEWELGLDEALVERGIRARTLSAEAERTCVRMKGLFRPIAIRYGDHYFNSVLVAVLHEMNVSKSVEVQDILDQISVDTPHKGTLFEDCREDIIAVLADVLGSLHEALMYSKDESIDIVTAALVRFLDDRFSVTSRQILGWTTRPRIDFWSLISDLAPRLPGKPDMKWTASATDVAFALQAAGLDTTAVTVERELLEHAEADSAFPWRVSMEPQSRKLVFEPKK